jgi:CDP-glucose 4,6-dehydratase
LFKNTGIERLLEASTESDIRDLSSLRGAIEAAQPEIVFHLAAQPLVQDSYQYPVETYSTNVMGTVNLFEAIRSSSTVRVVVNVTTDKVYENKEWVWGYRETDGLGGYDPYANSKACSELVTAAFRDSYFNEKDYRNHRVAIATARAGNVMGGGDWASNRLFPDCVRAFVDKKKVRIRYPNAIRPWQHVLDPLNGYMTLAKKLFENGSQFTGGWNFAPEKEDAKAVLWIVETTARLWGGNAGYTIESDANLHESAHLVLDNAKARHALGWRPRWHIEKTLVMAVEWFKSFMSGEKAYDICRSQIDLFEAGE